MQSFSLQGEDVTSHDAADSLHPVHPRTCLPHSLPSVVHKRRAGPGSGVHVWRRHAGRVGI